MPARTGGSHALASFATFIVGTVLSRYLWEYMPPLGEASLAVVGMLRATLGAPIPTSERVAGTLLLMVGLSFAWGVVYHLQRHG